MNRYPSAPRRSTTIFLLGRVHLGWLLVTFWLFTSQLVFGTDRHWTGFTNTTWSTTTNWDTIPPSGAADNAVFDGTFNNQPNLTSTTTAGGLWMTGNVGQNVTISGLTLTLQGNTINGTAGLGILMDNANAFTLTINAPLKLGAAQTWRNNSGNLLTIGAGGVNTNNKALTIDGSGNTTISGVISSNGSITKTGNGTLTLSGANTYGAGTTLSSGTLNINNAGSGGTSSAIGTSTFTINGGTIDNTTSGGITVSTTNAITLGANFTFGGTQNLNLGTGAITNAGNRTITLNGTNSTLTLGGTMTNTSNAVQTTTVNGAGNTLSLGGYALSNNGTGRIDIINGTGNVAITGAITNGGGGVGGLIYSGSGVLTLSGTNTFTGVLTVQSGTLSVGTINNASTNGVLGNSANAVILGGSGTTGTLEYTGGTQSSTKTFIMATSGTGAFQIDSSGTNLTLSGVIGGTGALSKTGAGTLTLSGTNAYTGATTISSGTLSLGNGGTTGALSTISSITDNANFTINRSNAVTQGTDFSGSAIAGTGSFTQAGIGTTTLNAANTYSGGTTVSAGTLQLSGSGTLGSTNGALTVNGGTLNLNGTTQGVGNLTGSGGTILNNATGTNVTLTIGNNNSTGGNYSGVIANNTSGTGTVALTKTGTGTITLSGTNTYTGATTVNAGTLLVNGSTAASSAVSVNNSGTTLGGTGTINGTVTVGSGANLLGGTGSAASGTLTLANNLTLSSGSIIELALGASGAHSTITRSGSGSWTFATNQAFTFINLGAQPGNYTNIITGLGSDPGESGWAITNTGWIGNFTYSSGDISLNVIAVPEPSTWIAGALALGALLLHQRRRWRCLIRRHCD